jgi:hypothetical protein
MDKDITPTQSQIEFKDLPPKLMPRSSQPIVTTKLKDYPEPSTQDDWSFGNLANILMKNAATSATLWSDSSSTGSFDNVLELPDIYSTDEEAINASNLLNLLEKEYQSLAQNPKSILAEGGCCKGNLKALNKNINGDDSLAEFWTQFLEKEPAPQLEKFHHLFLSKIISGAIPTELR